MAPQTKKTEVEDKGNPKCGVIMPISEIGTYTKVHWQDVKQILYDAIAEAGYEPNLVSESNEVRVIQGTIVQNIYQNEIVVCDVSAKNPNVMFELGLRLAFDKPTIIVKDDSTDYVFDTGQIEHICYPRELRYADIVTFKQELVKKITATIQASKDPQYTTFLKHFSILNPAKLAEHDVTEFQFIVERINELSNKVSSLQSMPFRIVDRKKDMSDNDKKTLMDLIRTQINNYCTENNIDEPDIYNNTVELSKLADYVEKNRNIRSLCWNRNVLEKMVDDLVLPF